MSAVAASGSSNSAPTVPLPASTPPPPVPAPTKEATIGELHGSKAEAAEQPWTQESLQSILRTIEVHRERVLDSIATVNHRELVGKWVRFDSHMQTIPKELQNPYKIISYWGSNLDDNRCVLMDINGKLKDYCPRVLLISSCHLPSKCSIRVLSKTAVSEMLGDTFKALEAKASMHRDEFRSLQFHTTYTD